MSANQKRSGEEALLFVLRHPLRRELLKLLVEGGEARSPKELARDTKSPVPNVSYHVRVLADGGAAVLVAKEPRRGSVEHFYQATALIDEVPWGRVALGLSESGGRR